jgi:hypothetical protein
VTDRANEPHFSLDYFLKMRGVEKACKRCCGMGTKAYSSTSTWRGGMGGSSITTDVCDLCWGSGCAYRIGADLRALSRAQTKMTDEAAIYWLKSKLGMNLESWEPYFLMLADHCDSMTRKRNIPQGYKPFWWCRAWEDIGTMLRKLTKVTSG